jgi:hypothetical protein
MGTLLDWPHTGTHRATGPLSERDLDAAHLQRALNPAHEPDELNSLQRQAADEQAASRRWHASQPCTGNCMQGRMCDCVADCNAEDDLPRQPLTQRERALLVAIVMGSAGTVSTVLWLIFGKV